MSTYTPTGTAVRQLQDEHGWSEEEARRFIAHERKMLLNDIVGVPPLTAAERRELGLDLKVGDEMDEEDDLASSSDRLV